MTNPVVNSTAANTPTPIGPYNHIAKIEKFISIRQAKQILTSLQIMLQSVDSDLNHVIHMNIFLKDMQDFEEMNRAYVDMMGNHRPARTVIGVAELPKPGVLLTMNLTAVTKE